MRKSPFFTLFIGTNVVFLFLYIHKASQCLHESYHKQELDVRKKELALKKQTLTQQLYAAKNRTSVHEFAHQQNMIPVDIKNIKRITG